MLPRHRYSYVISKRVPAELVPIIDKREIIKSLGTLDVNKAKMLFGEGFRCRSAR